MLTPLTDWTGQSGAFLWLNTMCPANATSGVTPLGHQLAAAKITPAPAEWPELVRMTISIAPVTLHYQNLPSMASTPLAVPNDVPRATSAWITDVRRTQQKFSVPGYPCFQPPI